MQINVCLKRLIYRKIYNMIELKIPSEAIDSIFSKFSIYGDRHEIPIEWWPDGLKSSKKYSENDFLFFKSVHKDENLFMIEDQLVKSPLDGYALLNNRSLCNYNRLTKKEITKEEAGGKVIGIVCEEIFEAIKYLMGPINCTLSIDPFTQKHHINGIFNGYWKKWFLEEMDYDYPYPMNVPSYEEKFYVDGDSMWPFFVF